jgi:hypothetical protein
MISGEKLKELLDRQDAAGFEKAISTIAAHFGSPMVNGTSDVAKIKVDNDSLLEYVFKWKSPLNPAQTSICKTLFLALGQHIVDGKPKNDPLLRACRENNVDMVRLLIPSYAKHQDVIVDNRQAEAIKNIGERVIASIKITTDTSILDIMESKESPHLAALSPTLHPQPSTITGKTYGQLFKEVITNRRKVLLQNPQQQQQKQFTAVGSYYKQGAMLGFGASVVLVGLFVGVSFLTDYCTHQYSENKFNANDMFSKIADWMWDVVCGQDLRGPQHPSAAATPLAGMLSLSGGAFGLISTAVGAALGARKPKNS